MESKFKNKKEIVNSIQELELTEYGDFILCPEITKKYEIIDFHTHTFSSVSGNLPKWIRRPRKDMNASFFDMSCYPESPKYFDLEKVGYRKWCRSFRSIKGIKTIWYLTVNGVLLIRKATTERLIRDLERQNIDRAVILPINTKDFDSTTETLKKIGKNEKLIPFGSIHPYDPEVDKKIEMYLNGKVKGFKINPHLMNVDILDTNMIRLIKKLSKTGLPIICCSGLQNPEYVRNIPNKLKQMLETQNIKKFGEILPLVSDTPFIFAHGGLEQAEQLIKLMKKYKNTYTDISTQPAKNIKRFIEEIGSNRILFGSDYPYLNQSFTILSVLRATDDENQRKQIFSINGKKLLNLE